MTVSDFTLLIKEPRAISKKQTSAIENMLVTYPYFQVAHVLRLNGLKKEHSFEYNKALKKTAAYTTNRTILFDFITANTLNIEKKDSDFETLISDTEVVDLEVIEKPVVAIKTSTIKQKPVLESLQIGEPLDFNKSEAHSFNEWLQLTSFRPIERTEDDEEIIAEKQSKNFELIEQFILTKPKIKPVSISQSFEAPKDSTTENESLMTETLARVYLEQKKYDKAIKAFKILSLKYPEKSGFFADRIKAVKFLQQNNT